jgi:hypothetical protein
MMLHSLCIVFICRFHFSTFCGGQASRSHCRDRIFELTADFGVEVRQLIRSTSCAVKDLKQSKADGRGQMTEAGTINDEELAILCDIVSGWGVKKWAENPGAAKKQSLDRLIAYGYVEPVHEASATRYQHTTKTEILFAQLCVGISGG